MIRAMAQQGLQRKGGQGRSGKFLFPTVVCRGFSENIFDARVAMIF
jgi:hypothetical protein